MLQIRYGNYGRPNDLSIAASVVTPPPIVTTVVGMLFMVFSLVFISANVIVIRIITTNREFYKHSSYRLMAGIGAADIGYSATHFADGAFIVARRSPRNLKNPPWLYWLGRFLDAAPSPLYVSYVLLTAVLALNRFVTAFSPSIERRFFRKRSLIVWIGLVEIMAITFFVVYMSPYARLTLFWERLNTGQLETMPWAYHIYRIAIFMEIGAIFIPTLLYFATFLILVQKKMKKPNHSFLNGLGVEWRILLQSMAFTGYITLSRSLWYVSQLTRVDQTMAWRIFAGFLRVFIGAVNPTIYYITNVYGNLFRRNVDNTDNELKINNA